MSDVFLFVGLLVGSEGVEGCEFKHWIEVI